jgi:membrane associated rhomboid family serine protease
MPRGEPSMMQFGVPPLTRGVKWLGGITLAVTILGSVEAGRAAMGLLVFFPAALLHRPWTPLTYTFFFDRDPMGLLFGLLGLWLIGAALEEQWGTRRFVTFYFVTSAVAALATAALAIVMPSLREFPYFGNWSALEGLMGAFAVLLPDAQIFLIFIPVQARWMLPISAGITVLFMIMVSWQAYLPQLLGLGAGVLFAGGVAPQGLLLRMRVWWIDRRLRRSKLRVVRGEEGPVSGGRGSDKYLH